MTKYDLRIGGVKYPIKALELTKHLDMRPSLFWARIAYQPLSFGDYVNVQIYRDDALYLEGSLYRPDHIVSGMDAPTTTVVGLCLKSRLMPTFRKPAYTGSSTVKYAPGTERAIFTDIIDASAGLKEGAPEAAAYSLYKTFKSTSCAGALELLMYLTSREAYVRNDYTVDLKASIGQSRSLLLKYGENVAYARYSDGDGFRVINDAELCYDSGNSTLVGSDAGSITQFGRRCLPYLDMTDSTDAAAVQRYLDNLLRDFKLPPRHALIRFQDTTQGLAYDVGDFVNVDVPKIGLVGQQRIYEIQKLYGPTGEQTIVALAKDVKAWDTRRYRANNLADVVSAMRGQLHSLLVE